jgi:DNA-binding FadR family transcriptional regulator
MTFIDLGSDLLNFIVENEFAPGDRLPTITELTKTDHLGISSSKIREQLEVARALGLVDVRSKTGTRLKPYSFTPAVRLSVLYALACNPATFNMFTELRNHIEQAFWHEACSLLQDDDLKDMQRCVDSAREKLSGEWIQIPHTEHRTFHLTVFKRLKNPFVIGLLEAYWDAYNAVQLHTYADFAYHQSVWDYHEQILEAIRVQDYDQALTAYIDHTQLLRHQPRMQTMKGENITESAIPD